MTSDRYDGLDGFVRSHADQVAALVKETDTELVAAEATYGTPRP